MNEDAQKKSLNESLTKLKKACIKQNKDGVTHYINSITSYSSSFDPSFTTLVFSTIKSAYIQCGNEDLFYKTSLLRLLEHLCALIKQGNGIYIPMVKENYGVLLDTATFIEQDREESGSSSVAGYLTDLCRLIVNFRKYFDHEGSTKIEHQVQIREQAANARTARRVENIRRIEDSRDKHKRVRENNWMRVPTKDVAPDIIPVNFIDAVKAFESDWEKIDVWNEVDYKEACLHSQFYNNQD